MKKLFMCLVCLIACFGVNFSFAYTEQDLLDALNKTYDVNGQEFKLPASIKNKAVNYIKANDVSEEQCNELMDVLDRGIDFANKVGTTDIKELSADDIKEGMKIVKEAASILDVEVKVNSTLDKITATDKDTGKIVEEIEKKEVFFKATGKERNLAFWATIAFVGLAVIIVAYVLLVKFVKFKYIDIICNTVMLTYIVCGMPFICFGSYIEMLDLLKPVLSSEVGEGHVDIVEIEIKDPTVSDKVEETKNKEEVVKPAQKVEENKTSSNDKVTENNTTEVKVEEPKVEEPKVEEPKVEESKEEFKYPVLGEMYAKLDIPSCDINLSVFYGDNESILDVGVGHFSGSHFPGQGKGILYTTHNTKDKLYNLKDIRIGNEVNVITNFGKFTYKVKRVEIIKDTDKNKAYIESDKELLMIYTCYPFDQEGYTDERYMVYCERSDV